MPVPPDVLGVGDRTNGDAELERAFRAFAQRMRIQGVPTVQPHVLVAPFDGGGAAIPSGQLVRVPVVWDCEIIEWLIVADVVGSISFGVQRATWSGYPTLASLIGTGTAPTVTNAQKNRGAPLGWSTLLRDSDVLVVSVASATTITNATLALRVRFL